MNDTQVKKLVLRVGALQAFITAAIGVIFWAFSMGRAEAEYVKRPDLAIMQQEIHTIQTDVAYIRGELDHKGTP